MGNATVSVRIAAEVSGYDRIAYDAHVCPACTRVIYIQQVEAAAADLTPVAWPTCPHCGATITLAPITVQRLVPITENEDLTT